MNSGSNRSTVGRQVFIFGLPGTSPADASSLSVNSWQITNSSRVKAGKAIAETGIKPLIRSSIPINN
ncbi:hypothetical protein QUF75_07685 [Desulfococcaceae bacterium HSG7]|nr:hypothetical protein [Desulfococcaceae bacterium HSG7]